MTAAGTEQGQGRECGNCGHVEQSHGPIGCYVLVGLFGGPVQCRCLSFSVHTVCAISTNPYPQTMTASPSVPPARDSGRDDVQSAAGNLTSGPGISSALGSGRDEPVAP